MFQPAPHSPFHRALRVTSRMVPFLKPGFATTKNAAMQMKVELQDRTTTCVSVEAAFEAPHDLVFNMLSDPANHTRIFSSIKEAKHHLVEEKGSSKTWSLDYKTAWKFWKVGGVCDTRCLMWTDSDKGTVTFRLREPGFLKVYEGTWTIRPAHDLMGSHPLADVPTSLDPDETRLDGMKAPSALHTATSSSSSPQVSLDNLSNYSSGSSGTFSTGSYSKEAGALQHRAVVPAVPARGLNDSSSPHSGREGGGGHKQLMVASVSMQADPLPSHSLSESLKCWLGDYVGATAVASGLPTNNLTEQLRSNDGGPSGASAEKAVQVPLYTVLTVEKKMAPKVQPPYPLNLALKGNAAGQIQEMVESLITASQEMAAADKAARK